MAAVAPKLTSPSPTVWTHTVRAQNPRLKTLRRAGSGGRLGAGGLIDKVDEAAEVDAGVVGEAHLAGAGGGIAVGAAVEAQVLQSRARQLREPHPPVARHACPESCRLEQETWHSENPTCDCQHGAPTSSISQRPISQAKRKHLPPFHSKTAALSYLICGKTVPQQGTSVGTTSFAQSPATSEKALLTPIFLDEHGTWIATLSRTCRKTMIYYGASLLVPSGIVDKQLGNAGGRERGTSSMTAFSNAKTEMV